MNRGKGRPRLTEAQKQERMIADKIADAVKKFILEALHRPPARRKLESRGKSADMAPNGQTPVANGELRSN